MNIVLIGYRGTGKSTVGKILAKKLKRLLIPVDDLIVKKVGMSIPEIVEKHGWDYFRDIESNVTKELSNQDNCIIDCGGGVILRDENVENLKQNGKCFLLKAEIDTIISRIQGDANRPALKEGMSFREEQEKVLKERDPKYKAAADVEIDTSILSLEQAVEKILENI
ncbi:MAG TPA: shikimate kinase [Nitrospinota bacterium]|jgi:shikimate kinase|nr:shikimate kinase [Nitrospinota bacterium]|tara:strand:- start:10 stop:510 length:501 start_codon:yes stop_codon:yes gene_type:complete